MSEKKRHPTRGPQAIINKQATALVEGWFAKTWIVQKQDSEETHEDYIIESLTDGEYSGEKFSAQQKGHATVRFKDGAFSESMETKHLRYYYERVKMPVFLFVVDTTKNRGYYIFVQEWIDQNVPPAKLKNQNHLSVQVPLKNDLMDAARFTAEFTRAVAYMAAKHPGDAIDAIKADAKAVEAIDPRFDVKLDVVNKQKQYTLSAKSEPINATLVLPPSLASELQKTIDYGVPTTLAGQGMKLTGSPLFEKWSKEGLQKVLKFSGNAKKISLNLWTEGVGSFRMNLDGTISSGNLGASIEANTPDNPLRVALKFAKSDLGKGKVTQDITIGFNWDKWTGRPLSSLPNFDGILGLLEGIEAKRVIHLEQVYEGNRLTAGKLGFPSNEDFIAWALAVIRNIRKARAIASRLRLEVRFPKFSEMKVEDLDVVDFVYELLFNGPVVQPVTDLTQEGRLNRSNTNEDPRALIERLEANAIGPLKLIYNETETKKTLYGVEAIIGPLVYEIAPAKFSVPEPGRTEFIHGRSDSVAAVIIATEGATATIRPPTPGEI